MTKTNAKANVADTQEEVVLKVKRELIPDAKTKAGEDMYAYVIKEIFKVNGQDREFRAEFTTKGTDFGGYDMLDIIFMISDEAYLSVKEDFMTNESTGETIPYTIYEIWNEDEDGVVYSYKIKPARDSDKAKLSVIIQKKTLAMQKANNKAAVAAGTEGNKQ